jgi:beta-lactamase superfamily II metal-dependent hydrolase
MLTQSLSLLRGAPHLSIPRIIRTLPLVALIGLASPALAQGNGKLQLHFMDVGQGDGALLVTPGGQTVLFDNGVLNQCSRPVGYLARLGVSQVDYHVASHYHADHIGCTEEVLSAFPLQQLAFDRGGSYTTATYSRYVGAVGAQRQTAPIGSSLALEGGVSLDFIAANGDGVGGADDENDLSVAVRVRYGDFDAVFAGDLSGVNAGGYADVESSVAPRVGQVEVYKVNHHASRYSSNANWLSTVRPKIGIVSVSSTNGFGHPTLEAMSRLHSAGVHTYWTSPGNGVPAQPPLDFVGGDIVVEIPPSSPTFTVRAAGQTHSYTMWGAAGAPPGAPSNFAATVSGNNVSLTWLAPTTGGVPNSYLLEALTGPGGTPFITVPVAGMALNASAVPNGTYFLRVRAVNGDGQSDPSNEITVIVPGGGCTSPPNAPGTLTGLVNGALISLGWGPSVGGCPATGYSLQAGSGGGLSDIGTFGLGNQTGFSASAPPGTYFVRIVASNAFGTSAPSNEVVLTVVGGCTSPPNAPFNLTGSVSGTNVSLNWAGSAGGCEPTSYSVQAGSSPGSSNIAVANVGLTTSLSAGAPAGTYYLRVVASNAFGTSSPSNEIVLTIACQLPPAPMLLTPSVSGSTVTLSWTPVGGATSYVLEAGSSSGGANLLNTTTGATGFTWSGAPAGTHFIRVKARNGCGTGPASNQVTATVSGGGNPTCGPTTAPCGQATARCNDGTYSCSQNRSGTCSSHGGVACWICPGTLCSGISTPTIASEEDLFTLWAGDEGSCGS